MRERRTTPTRLTAIARHWGRRKGAAPLSNFGTKEKCAQLRRRAFHLSRRAPTARADLSSDKERLGSGSSPLNFQFPKPRSKSASSRFCDFLNTGCRGHPCPRRCGTQAGSTKIKFPALASRPLREARPALLQKRARSFLDITRANA